MEYTLIELLEKGVSAYEVVNFSKEYLISEGFTELDYMSKWDLSQPGKYFLTVNGTGMFVFSIGDKVKDLLEKNKCQKLTLRLAAAHTDYPSLRIKPNPDFKTDIYAQVNVEVYGGPILNTWFDRPLGVSGRVVVKSDNVLRPREVIFTSDRPLMVIPNLAIHMNRDVNKGVEINNQTDLMPIIAFVKDKGTDYFMEYLSRELGVVKDQILDFELNTFVMDKAVKVGIDEDMLLSPRLDNLTSVYSIVSAIARSNRLAGVNIAALFDHEEIGNKSRQGAASILLHDMVIRILTGIGFDYDMAQALIADGMLLSCDVAHAMHPNKMAKMDIVNKPVMSKGFCIKSACSQSYATDSLATGIVIGLCKENNIDYQRFVNRSDLRGGGTLGSVAESLLPLKTVDVGIPILAMHSAAELMSEADLDSLTRLCEEYFSKEI